MIGQHMGIPAQNNGYGTQYLTGAVPYHTQSAPTQVLYEQARQAAVAKASPHSRRPGLPSQRRPWSTEEENALMAGLDQVKGPHWSQILALYGAKGQVSEILKDRNQVQLKDKARNLKLFFLKSNIEVPYYLQCVTGELKTRAPSQAARKEAEERARLAGDEEQARFNGIMALASGMQQAQSSHGPASNPSGASRENSQESLHVTDETIKAEPETGVGVSFENSLGARLKENMAGQETPAEAPIAS
jgi:protein TBF1